MKRICLLVAVSALLAGCSTTGGNSGTTGTSGDTGVTSGSAGTSSFTPTSVSASGHVIGGGSETYDLHGIKTLSIMFHTPDPKDMAESAAYKARVDAFVTKYADQGIKVKTIFKARSAGATDYELELTNMKIEGTLPDIITFDAPNCASYAKSKILYDITGNVDVEAQKDFLSLNTYDNKIYGLPIQESSAGFFYNKNIFAAAGIDVSDYTVKNPWTFTEFKEVCKKLKDYGTTAVDMRLGSTGDETATYLLYPFINAAGGEFLSPDGLTATGYMNSDKSKAGFQFIKDLIDAGYTSSSIAADAFVTGKAGMYLSSGWTIPELDNKYPKQFPDRNSWGLLPYPQSEKKASATGSWCYGITQNNQSDKAAALALLDFLTSAESTNEVTTTTGMIPSRKSCNPSYGEKSPEKLLFDQLDQTGKTRPATVKYPQFSDAFRKIIFKLPSQDVNSLVDAETTNLQNEINKK